MSLETRISALTKRFWDLNDPDLTHMVITLASSSASPSDLLSKLTQAGADTNLSEAAAFLDIISSSRPSRPSPVPLSRPSDPLVESFTGLTLPRSSAAALQPSDDVSDQQLFELQQMRLAGLSVALPRPQPTVRPAVAVEEDADAITDIRPLLVNPPFLKNLPVPAGPHDPPVSVDSTDRLNRVEPVPAEPVVASVPDDRVKWSIKGPMTGVRARLPIYAYRENLVECVRTHPVTVLIGETGSGKSTNLPQFLLESGFLDSSSGSSQRSNSSSNIRGTSSSKGIIGITQPRRVAATTVARRVAEEQGVRLGEEVGYSIRFDDCTGPRTKIKYMTDGILLQELSVRRAQGRHDELGYKVIILDEVHERSVNTDILMALLKKIVFSSRTGAGGTGGLRLVLTSATLEAERFASYFSDPQTGKPAPVMRIPGRTYPVSIRHSKVSIDDYVSASVTKCMSIVDVALARKASGSNDAPDVQQGHILIFLTGQEEIERCAMILRDLVNERMKHKQQLLLHDPELLLNKEQEVKIEIEVLYASLTGEQQSRVFRQVSSNVMKIVISTNVAEASVTVDGVVHVVDGGKAKIKRYNEKTGKESLLLEWISQASAEQRAGRAGRTREGVCYRLYTEGEYKEIFKSQTEPELLRSDLSGVVLMLKTVGVEDVLQFDFIQRPKTLLLVDAMKRLYGLGALDDEGGLTKLGKRLSSFPLAPEMSKVMLASIDLECTQEAAVVLAFLSEGGNVFVRPEPSNRLFEVALSKHREFFNTKFGDLVTYLEIYTKFVKSGKSKNWCNDRFLNFRTLSRIEQISDQLISMVHKQVGRNAVSCRGEYARLAKAFCAGYFANAVVRDGSVLKLVRDDSEVFVHPSSVLADRAPRFFIFTELVITTREFVRNICVIDPKWLPECAPVCFRAAQAGGLGDKRKLAPIGVKKGEEDAWRLKKRLGF